MTQNYEESKKIVDKTIASKIFFLNEKYTAIRIKIEKTLIDSNVSSKRPSGKKIIFEITDIIIPIEIHSIQSKNLESVLILFDNFTPKALHM